MTQRNNHSPIAIAQPQGQASELRAATLRLMGVTVLATVALITVLVLITGPISAEYGFV